MLRLTALVLILANAGYFAWSDGYLQAWGLGPTQQAEPHRLNRQIQPEAVRVLQPEEARKLLESGPAARGTECLASAPLDEPMMAAVRRALSNWPAGSWELEPAVEPGRWIVYMGKYADTRAVERKKAELRYRGVPFEPLANASLEPGLSLGGFSGQVAANEWLNVLAGRGVRTARVVLERPELRGPALRLPAVDDALRSRLEELRSVMGGQAMRPCR